MSSPAIYVHKADLAATQVRDAPSPPLAPGQARLTLDLFALTANNVTYAAMGEAFKYWDFFPAPEGLGLVPVWGFATVSESRVDGLHEGERIWGYYPFAQELVVTPAKLTDLGFADAAAHRAGLPPVYNQYERVARDPMWAPQQEARLALLRPLFTTSFLIDDYAAEQGFFGAERVAFLSASSKTALGAAKLMKARGGVQVIALTSPANAAFCRQTGYFDTVVSYDALGGLDRAAPLAVIDMAGDAGLIDALADHLTDAFIYNMMVGAAHWRDGGRQTKGPPRTLFFAPDRIVQRTREWGKAGYGARYQAAWSAFTESLTWLDVREARGPHALQEAWGRLLAGKVSPQEGLIGRFGSDLAV
jgi:NADPH:quinone reductase-like Zn-dependent oxidoreductase